MSKKRSAKSYTKQVLRVPPSRPTDWEEAMERGVFLLNERNRAFVEYRSQDIYLPTQSPLIIARQWAPFIIFGSLGVGWLYSLYHDLYVLKRLEADLGWLIGIVGTVLLLGGLMIGLIINAEMRRRKRFVLEGKLIFVPIAGCGADRSALTVSKIDIVYDFISPVSQQHLTGRYIGEVEGDRFCPAEGTVAAILFRNDKEYQVL